MEVTNADQTIESLVDNSDSIVMDFKKEVVRKKNKYAAKRKTRLENPILLYGLLLLDLQLFYCLILCLLLLLNLQLFCHVVLNLPPIYSFDFILFLVQNPLLFPSLSCSRSFVLLLPYSMHAPTAKSPTFSLLCSEHTLAAGISTLLSTYSKCTLTAGFPALLLPCPLPGPVLSHLKYLALKIFKQLLSDEFWLRLSSSLTQLFCLFPILGLYNLINNTKLKWTFYITFINSRPLVNNHAQKEFDQSFAGCKCLTAVKLNQSWQLDILDPKPVSIMEAISLIVALFQNSIFASYPWHTLKLAFRLDLRITRITSSIVKEKKETV